MSKSITRQKRSAAWRKCRSTSALRHAPPKRTSRASRKRLQGARAALTRSRKATQARIVAAFRKLLQGAGSGPVDEELRAFARLAVAELRLGRRLGERAVSREASCEQRQVRALELQVP